VREVAGLKSEICGVDESMTRGQRVEVLYTQTSTSKSNQPVSTSETRTPGPREQ
jgi:hypothetical protein